MAGAIGEEFRDKAVPIHHGCFPATNCFELLVDRRRQKQKTRDEVGRGSALLEYLAELGLPSWRVSEKQMIGVAGIPWILGT